MKMNGLTFAFIWMPAAFMMLMTAANLWVHAGMKKLISFYAAMLVGTGVGALMGGGIGAIAGEPAGTFVGIIAGGVVGGAAGLHSCGLASGLSGTPAEITSLGGGAIGGFTGMFVGILAGQQNYTAVIKYFLFLLAAEVVCLFVVCLVKYTAWLAKNGTLQPKDQ